MKWLAYGYVINEYHLITFKQMHNISIIIFIFMQLSLECKCPIGCKLNYVLWHPRPLAKFPHGRAEQLMLIYTAIDKYIAIDTAAISSASVSSALSTQLIVDLNLQTHLFAQRPNKA